jgi:TIGR03009 family protein
MRRGTSFSTIVGLLLAAGQAGAQNGSSVPDPPGAAPAPPQNSAPLAPVVREPSAPPQGPPESAPLPAAPRPAAEQGGPYRPAGQDAAAPPGGSPPTAPGPGPGIQRRLPAGPPFVLSPDEQQDLAAVLVDWERRGREIKTFRCDFTRLEYRPDPTDPDPRIRDGTKPRFVDVGYIRFAAPDKGLFHVDPPRPDQWLCDGRSIYEFRYQRKEMWEYPLPPESRGEAIADGPLPFLFGAAANKLNDRYWLRVKERPGPNEVLLQGFPKRQKDATNFSCVELILRNMQPYAIKVYDPNKRDNTVYVFEHLRVNESELFLPIFGRGDAFRPSTPRGWKKIIENPAPPEPAALPQQMR